MEKSSEAGPQKMLEYCNPNMWKENIHFVLAIYSGVFYLLHSPRPTNRGQIKILHI